MSSKKPRNSDQWEMRVAGLAMDPANNAPVVVLRDVDNVHQVPIWIGQIEAIAIATELEGIKYSRPMTHDLICNIVEDLGWTIERVEIYDISDSTFLARLVVSKEDDEIEIESRPSDAIAVAMRAKVNVLASDHVVQQARMDIPEKKEAKGTDDKKEPDEAPEKPSGPRPLVGPMPDSDEEWENLLEKLDPEDFGKYKQ